jgi:CRP-like cAMP-binding protein
VESSFIDLFKKFKFLQLRDLHALYKISKMTTIKAGEIILRDGEYYPYIIGIIRGSVRTYVLQSNGEEKTVRIAMEKDFTGAASSLLKGEPSEEFLQAVEDCTLILIHAERMKEMGLENINLLRLWNEAVMDAFYEATHRILFFVALNPEERYRQILIETPQMILRVPQKYLASYIGVTTVSLSRIKARVAEES